MIKIIRASLILTGSILLLLFLAPLTVHIINIGNIIGITASSVLIFAGIFLRGLLNLCKKIRANKKGKITFNVIFSIGGALLMCFLIALGSTIAGSVTNADSQSTVIVLGCAVRGTVPSKMLMQRINAAYDYLNENPDSVAILSGGQGPGERISEAECMYNVLTEKGIDGDRLFLEDKSTNTFENITYSKKIIDDNALSGEIAIASSEFHLKRAVLVAKKQGINAKKIASETDFLLRPTYYVRDTLGVIMEVLTK